VKGFKTWRVRGRGKARTRNRRNDAQSLRVEVDEGGQCVLANSTLMAALIASQPDSQFLGSWNEGQLS
jgi:hypothetical protein